jgi:hypothetical protein
MSSAAPTQTDNRKIGGAFNDGIVGRIDLIVPRVIIMRGRAQLSSRGCGDEFGLAPVFGCSVHGSIVNAWRGIGITSQKQIGCTPMVCCGDFVVR